jgi:hypothetical protein
MVKRRKTSTKRRVVKGTRGYKKCIVNTIRRIKFTTPKAARKAFTRAAKICRKKLAGKATPKKTGKRRCKYGKIKGGKRCRKTPRRR